MFPQFLSKERHSGRNLISFATKLGFLINPEKTVTPEQSRSRFTIDDFARAYGTNIVEESLRLEGFPEVTISAENGIVHRAITRLGRGDEPGKFIRYHAAITHDEGAHPYAFNSVFIAKDAISAHPPDSEFGSDYAAHLIKVNDIWMLGSKTYPAISSEGSEWPKADSENATYTMLELFNVTNISRNSSVSS